MVNCLQYGCVGTFIYSSYLFTLLCQKMKSVWAFSGLFQSLESHKVEGCEWLLGILCEPPATIRRRQPPTDVENRQKGWGHERVKYSWRVKFRRKDRWISLCTILVIQVFAWSIYLFSLMISKKIIMKEVRLKHSQAIKDLKLSRLYMLLILLFIKLLGRKGALSFSGGLLGK